MNLFACKHPARFLAVYGREKVEPMNADFEEVTTRLICQKCGERIDLKCSAFVGGVDAFMTRKLPRESA